MLRTTFHETAGSLTCALEGGLEGLWVRQLEGLLHRALMRSNKSVIRLDLAGVTRIDDQGKDFLAIMQMHGVELLANGPLMSSVVATLAVTPISIG